MKSQEELKDAADRAFELLEQKSPHQLAVELAHLQRKHGIAVSALNKIGAQRDQLAFQLKDATAQCGVMAGLLRELREGAEIHLHNCTVCKNEQGIANWTSKLERIDATLAGKLSVPVVPEGWQLEALDNDCIVVRKDGVGFYVASFNAENIASTILHALASDMLATAPKPEGGA